MLRELRKRAGLTQQELAEAVGISRPSITCYETGRLSLDVKVAKKIAKVLGCKWWELYDSDCEEERIPIEKDLMFPLLELKQGSEGKLHFFIMGEYEVTGQGNEFTFIYDHKKIAVRIEGQEIDELKKQYDSQLKK